MIFSISLIVAAVTGLFLLVILCKAFFRIREAEVMIIERLGRFHRILNPGIHWIIPFVDKPRTVVWHHITDVDGGYYRRLKQTIERIDLREAVYDFPKQNVITRDNVTTEINAYVYYHVIDPKKAVYEVYDLPEAIEKLAQTTLRNVIGSMDLDETLFSRDHINTRLRTTLDEAAHKWGVNVTRVELQDVNPHADIRQAMEKQMRAERDRRAVILEAEGLKQAAILRAEGEQEARVSESRGFAEAKTIMAEGEATARLTSAKAEAQAIEMLSKALPKTKDPMAYLIAQQYLKTLPSLTEGKNTKLVIVPYESSALVGGIASLKKVFEEAGS